MAQINQPRLLIMLLTINMMIKNVIGQDYPFLCRNSDYRMFSSDPEWTVTNVLADVEESTYAMLMAVTATNEEEDTITNIYLFEGWICYTRLKLEIDAPVVEQVRVILKVETLQTFILHKVSPNTDELFLTVFAKDNIDISYQIKFDDEVESIPLGLQIDKNQVYFSVGSTLNVVDIVLEEAVQLETGNTIGMIAIDGQVVIVNEEEGLLLVYSLKSDLETVDFEKEIDHGYGVSQLVVRLGASLNESNNFSGFAMCSYLPSPPPTAQYVTMDHISSTGDVIGYKTDSWAQCLSAIGENSDNSDSKYLLMSSEADSNEVTINIVSIDFQEGSIKSRTSKQSDFLSFDSSSHSAYGILFHDDQFIFGITDSVYDTGLEEDDDEYNGAFLMNTDKYRLTYFFKSAYATDSSITQNNDLAESSTSNGINTKIDNEENLIDYSEDIDSVFRFESMSFNRFGYQDQEDLCPILSESDVMTTLYNHNKGQQINPEPFSLENFELGYADVCYPLEKKTYMTANNDLEVDNKQIKFPQNINIKDTKTTFWVWFSFNDQFEAQQKVLLIAIAVVINQHTIEAGKDFSFDVIPFASVVELKRYQLTLEETTTTVLSLDDACKQSESNYESFNPFHFDESEFKMKVYGRETEYLDCFVIYGTQQIFEFGEDISFFYLYHSLVFIQDVASSAGNNLGIMIDLPWVEYYEREIYNEPEWVMTKPSRQQIKESSLSPRRQELLINLLFDANGFSKQRAEFDKLDAQLSFYEDQLDRDAAPIEWTQQLNPNATISIVFSRELGFPSYMLDTINEEETNENEEEEQGNCEEAIENGEMAQDCDEMEENEEDKEGSGEEEQVNSEEARNDGHSGQHRRLQKTSDVTVFPSHESVLQEMFEEIQVEAFRSIETTNIDLDALKEQIQELITEVAEDKLDEKLDELYESSDCYTDESGTIVCDDWEEEEEEEEYADPDDFYIGKLKDYIYIYVETVDGDHYSIEWEFVFASKTSFVLEILPDESRPISKGDILHIENYFAELDTGFDNHMSSDATSCQREGCHTAMYDYGMLAPAEVKEEFAAPLGNSGKAVLLLTTIVQIVSNGSLSQLWGMINGMQIASYLPIINISIGGIAGTLSAFIAGIVTFDIPGVDMESVLGSWFACPEEDAILSNLGQPAESDFTIIKGTPWFELRPLLLDHARFNRTEFVNSLSESERKTFTHLAYYQEEIGWNNSISETVSEAFYYIEGLDLLGFASSYLSRTLGTAFLFILLITMGLFMIIILKPFTRISYANTASEKLKKKLLWGVFLRTLMQTSLEFGFCVIFTLSYATYDGSLGAIINFGYAYTFSVLLVVFPILTYLFYKRHLKKFCVTECGDADLDTTNDYKLEQLCSEYSEDQKLEGTIKRIQEADSAGQKEVLIDNVTKSQLAFFGLLKDLRYIEEYCEAADLLVVLTLTGKFHTRFQSNMDWQTGKEAFMRVYGDPLDGLDLSKPIVIWYPTYFVVKRMVFVLTTVWLWNEPIALLTLRLLSTLASFLILSVVEPFQTRRANQLELLNETMTIIIIDCIYSYTDIMNEGNVDDGNAGNTSNLLDSQFYVGWLYITVFIGTLSVHFSFLIKDTVIQAKDSCRRRQHLAKLKKQEGKSLSPILCKFFRRRKLEVADTPDGKPSSGFDSMSDLNANDVKRAQQGLFPAVEQPDQELDQATTIAAINQFNRNETVIQSQQMAFSAYQQVEEFDKMIDDARQLENIVSNLQELEDLAASESEFRLPNADKTIKSYSPLHEIIASPYASHEINLSSPSILSEIQEQSDNIKDK